MNTKKIFGISLFLFASLSACVFALPSGYGKVKLGMSVDA